MRPRGSTQREAERGVAARRKRCSFRTEEKLGLRACPHSACRALCQSDAINDQFEPKMKFIFDRKTRKVFSRLERRREGLFVQPSVKSASLSDFLGFGRARRALLDGESDNVMSYRRKGVCGKLRRKSTPYENLQGDLPDSQAVRTHRNSRSDKMHYVGMSSEYEIEGLKDVANGLLPTRSANRIDINCLVAENSINHVCEDFCLAGDMSIEGCRA